jgi:hypothetical protein
MRTKSDFKPADMAAVDRKGHNQALQRFYDALGQDEMVQALHHSADPRVVMLLEYMFDPKYRNDSFTKLCKECNLHLGDVVDAFRRYKFDLGIVAMAHAAPRIMKDTAEDAKSSKALCMTCMGLGEVLEPDTDPEQPPSKLTCPNCVGEGTFRVPGHDKARELFFKTMGPKTKAPLIAQQFNFPPDNTPSVEDVITEAEKASK